MADNMTISIKAMTKDAILKRLHLLVGICPMCGMRVCAHIGAESRMRILPPMINSSDVMRAINVDEKYHAEDAPEVEAGKSTKHPMAHVTVHKCR